MSSTDRLAALEARLDQLSRENRALADEVAALQGADPGRAALEPSSTTTLLERRPVDEEVVDVASDGSAVLDRRKVLRNLGGLAAASVGLVAAGGVLRPLPASAEAFTALIIGESQGGAQHSTQLTATPGSGTSSPLDSATFAATNTGAGSSGSRVGLFGRATDQGTGVYGEGLGGDSSHPSYGVYGTTNASVSDWYDGIRGAGIYGRSSADNGVGVVGLSAGAGGTGIYAEGGSTTQPGVGIRADAPIGAPLLLVNSGLSTVPPTSGSWNRGSFIVKDGELWFCTVGGTNSRWTPLSSNNLVTLQTPDRVYDSRPGQPPSHGTQSPLTRLTEREIDITASGSVPATANAVLLNLTIIPNTSGRGFLTLWKDGETQPTASSANFNGSLPTAVANNATVALSEGKIRAVIGGESNVEVDLALDVIGYYL
jgi:hypothetical protein